MDIGINIDIDIGIEIDINTCVEMYTSIHATHFAPASRVARLPWQVRQPEKLADHSHTLVDREEVRHHRT